VRRKLGYHDESNSYIHFLILKITGINLPVALVDSVTLIVFMASAVISIVLNIRDWRKR